MVFTQYNSNSSTYSEWSHTIGTFRSYIPVIHTFNIGTIVRIICDDHMSLFQSRFTGQYAELIHFSTYDSNYYTLKFFNHMYEKMNLNAGSPDWNERFFIIDNPFFEL